METVDLQAFRLTHFAIGQILRVSYFHTEELEEEQICSLITTSVP